MKLSAESLAFLGSMDEGSKKGDGGMNGTCEADDCLLSWAYAASFGNHTEGGPWMNGDEAIIPPMPDVTLRFTLPTEDSRVFGSNSPLTVRRW